MRMRQCDRGSLVRGCDGREQEARFIERKARLRASPAWRRFDVPGD